MSILSIIDKISYFSEWGLQTYLHSFFLRYFDIKIFCARQICIISKYNVISSDSNFYRAQSALFINIITFYWKNILTHMILSYLSVKVFFI